MAKARELLARAEHLRWEKRLDEAEAILREAVETAEAEQRDASLLLAECVSWLGVVLTLRAADEEQAVAALDLHERAFQIARDACGENHPSAAESLRLMAIVLERLGKSSEAFEALSRSTRIFAHLGTRSRSVLDALARLSELALQLGQVDAAVAAAQEYLQLPVDEPLSDIEELAGHLHAGRALLAAGRPGEALSHFERNVELAAARGRERSIREMEEWLAKARAALASP